MKQREVFVSILWMAVALLALPVFSFTKMDITRGLLMNDDTNETWEVLGQGYINTNSFESTYWIHEGDPAPTSLTAPAQIVDLGVLDGTRHTFFVNVDDGDSGLVSTPLWQLENCRAGNAATTNYPNRHFIPWSSTSVPRDGIGVEYEATTIISNYVPRPRPHYDVVTNTFYDFSQVATVNMQNTTNSFVISPYYKDGIGAVYFDFVNGWFADNASEIQIQVSTETNGLGSLSFAEETNYSNLVWRTQKFDVFKVLNKTSLSAVSTGVSAFTPSAPNSNYYGNFFYRARAMLNLHQAARFRIWRSKRNTSQSALDATAYIIIDNIVASYPPVEVEIKQYGKYDRTRRGVAVLGQEGVFDVPFPHSGQSALPWAYYEGKTCPYAETIPADFTITSPRFYYRWRYLDQIVEGWKSSPMTKSGTSNLVTIARNAVKLGNDPGDVEFYYTLTMTKAPHYEPFDFSVGLNEPYGAGWSEDANPWDVTYRRDASDGIIAATLGTDWFVRLREGASDCREVVLLTTIGEPGVEEGRINKSVRMELVGDHSWRTYIECRRDDVGKSLRFHMSATKLSALSGGGFDSETTYWAPLITTNNVLPCSAVAVESETEWGEVVFDGKSGHLMVEYNDETHAVSLTRGEYQNFNLWTDANVESKGYVGHSTDTNSPAMSGVSPAKNAYAESFDKWEPKEAKSVYWVEDFSGGVNDPGFPYNVFFSKHKTPNGWAAENLMFVGEAGSTSYVTNGMAIQLEGRGKGFVQYADKANMPDGLDSVMFTARAAQFLEFDDFAYYLDGTSYSDYALATKVTMTYKGSRDRDVSPGAPSVSLVGYYRATKGCYEFRMTRVDTSKLEYAIYRWNKSGNSVTSTLIKKGTTSTNPLLPSNESHTSWPSAYIALYNGTDRTYITVALANAATLNNTTYAQDSSAGRFSITLTAEDADEKRHTKGAFGVGSCDCPARFGRLLPYDVSLSSGTVRPSFSSSTCYGGISVGAWNAIMKVEDNWALPPGRMEMMDNATELAAWVSGVVASAPDQGVVLYLAKTGSGNDWVDLGYSVAVTSFVANAYALSPRLVEKYNVRLSAGGGENDARTDVVLDDMVLTQWHAGSWEDWSEWTYPIAYTNWVYKQCWVEALMECSVPGAYDLKTLADTEEYVYIFTNSCKFTPLVDLEVSRALIVGGGGSGGATMGGGGGGGGVIEYDWTTNTVILRAGREVTVTVGAGAAAKVPTGTGSNSNSQPCGQKGGNSALVFNTGTLNINATAYGGAGGHGWGAAYSGTPYASGSGGSGNRNGSAANTPAQGNKGGNGGQGGSGTSRYGLGGGGGGAGSEGQNYNAAGFTAGAGGAGRPSDITGTMLYYGAGGGGGGGYNTKSVGGQGGKSGDGTGNWGKGGDYKKVIGSDDGAQPGQDYFGGGGGGGTYMDANGTVAVNIQASGARGGSGAVILRLMSGGKLATMQPRRAKPEEAVMIRSPYLNGISLFSFSFANADPNANLRLQMATNSFGTADFARMSQSLTDDRWIDVTNFTFETESDGTRTYFFGLREPIWGFVRLLCEPSKVWDAATNDSYAAYSDYGAITITSAVAYDEPILDDRSWFGWNMRTSSDSYLAYLPDPAYVPAGLSGALNFTGQNSPEGEFADELAAASGDYATHDPFIQSPAIYNEAGVGQVQFRARVMDTNSAVSSWVSVYGSSDSNADDADWTLLKNVEVTNRTYRTFLWKTTDDISPYKAVRLSVHAAKYGRDGDTSKEDGVPLAAPIQRVLLEEIAVTEPIAPGITFASVSPFRTNLDQDPVKAIPNARAMEQQPLLGESFGVQVEVAAAQLADELDIDSIRVFMAYYPSAEPWGYAAWSNKADAVQCELVRCTDSNMVWRSAYASGYEDSVIPPQQDPGDGRGVVVQYFVWAEYLDTIGTNHSHRVLSSEWANPEWYYPLDYNVENGGRDDPEKFCPYTILQTISPKRAWVNCMNIFDKEYDPSIKNQYLELAVPSGVNMAGWRLRFTEQTLDNTTVFAELGVGSIASEKTSVNVYNSYDFLTLQSPRTTTDKGYAADGTWYGFSLLQDSAANGTFNCYDSYAVELIRPNGIIEHQIVIGGTNQWEEYVFWKDYDPEALRDKLVLRDAGKASNWVLAGADKTDGSVGVMANHGAITNNWEQNLAQTPEARNRRRNGTYQTIPSNWYIPPYGTNYWVYSYIFGDHISQSSGRESGSAIRLIVPKGTTTNIVYKVDPWYRIASFISNDVSVAAPPFNRDTLTYTYTLDNVSTNISLKATSGLAPEVDSLVPAGDSYRNAIVKWLEGYNCESNIVLAQFQKKSQSYAGDHISLKEMYWLDIYPFQTNRLVVGLEPIGDVPIPPENIVSNAVLPAYTNVKVKAYMMITNIETGEAHAPYTVQGLGNESSAYDYSELSPNWTSATYKVVGMLVGIESVWRSLAYFVFDENSFVPRGQPDEFTSLIEVWDPFSSLTPIYSDQDARWWPYRGNNILFKAKLDEEAKPVRVRILKQVTTPGD